MPIDETYEDRERRIHVESEEFLGLLPSEEHSDQMREVHNKDRTRCDPEPGRRYEAE